VITLADWEESGTTEEPVVVDCGELQGQSVRPGEVQKSCGKAAYSYIEAAVRAAISGRTQAVATAPIHKEAFRMAGVPYPGHTELLAALTGSQRVCMMMASERIVVSLVTAHRSLREVAREITAERVFHVIDLTAAALRRLGTRKPCIGVCGLNPHAGEHGILGAEDRTGVLPAIARAREKGIEVEGPIPADTAFLPRKLQLFDAYVAMYHDQGLIPFKMLAFETGVNITLGLPIVRTSVDHGTAFDIAWQGVASPESLIQSVLWAKKLAWRR
jgi:4-hydroxythreonine-4-phosphate dehydrogenase